MNLDALKRQFAELLFETPGNPFAAACTIFPSDTGAACKYAVEWVNDSIVKNYLKEFEETREAANIPSKIEIIKTSWNLANNEYLKGSERVEALKLCATICEYMPEKTVNKNIKLEENQVNRVMVVKDHGNDDEWEEKCSKQQAGLINGK